MSDLILIFAAILSSSISGVTGLGGGTILLALMSLAMPVPMLIPAHAMVQLGSNLSRVYFNKRDLDRRIILLYGVGALLGAALGSALRIELPEKVFAVGIGLFVLLSVWLPIDRLGKDRFSINYGVLGFFSTLFSFFVGVTGPLVHPFMLKEARLSRFGFFATEASCSAFTHFLKIIVFGLWGISLAGHWRILSLMLLATIVGTYVGSWLLGKIHDQQFKLAVKWIITLVATRLLYQGLL